VQVRLTAVFIRHLLAGDPPAKTGDYFDTSLARFFRHGRPAARPDQPFSADYYIRYAAASSAVSRSPAPAPPMGAHGKLLPSLA